MTKRNRPLCDSGRLEDAISDTDPYNIDEAHSLDKTERDRFLTLSWSTENDFIQSLGIPIKKGGRQIAVYNSILTEAMIAHELGHWVSYSRRNEFYTGMWLYYGPDYTYATVVHAVDQLHKLGLLDDDRARPGDHMRTERQSRFRASADLVTRWHAAARAKFQLQGLIRLKDADGYLTPYRETDATRRMIKELRGVNEFLASHVLDLNTPDAKRIGHHILLDGAYLLPTTLAMYRVFNGGSFKLGGRGYWWGQSIPKARRPGLLLNGEPTLEPDFSAYHVTMLYHEIGLVPPDHPYDLGERFTRGEAKIAVNVALNCGSGKGAVVATLLYKRFQKDRHTGLPKWTLDRDSTAALVDALWKKHAPIERYLGTGAGLHLMNRDSRITLDILKRCERLDIAALSWHDSFRFQERQVGKGAEIMEAAYAREFKGAKPCPVRVSEKSVPQMPSSPPVSLPPSSLSLERAAPSGAFEAVSKALNDDPENLADPQKGRGVQLDLLAGVDAPDPVREAIAAVSAYEGGIIPEPIIRVVRDLRYRTGESQEETARSLGISRPQLANAESPRFGLGREPATRLRRWVQKHTDAA